MIDTKNIESRVESFSLLLNLFQEQNFGQKYPPLTPVLASLQNRIDRINQLHFGNKKTYSDLKKTLKRNLSTAAYHVSCGVYAYAQITGNAALKNAVYYSFSDFYRPAEQTTIGRARQVLNVAHKIKNAHHYGLTPAVINALEIALTQFIDFMQTPVLKIKKQARAHRQAETLLNQCLSILQKQLDPLMVTICCTEKSFAVKYPVFRKIKKSKGRKRKYVKKLKLPIQAFPAQTPEATNIKTKPAPALHLIN